MTVAPGIAGRASRGMQVTVRRHEQERAAVHDPHRSHVLDATPRVVA
jgi:hypothetical protein